MRWFLLMMSCSLAWPGSAAGQPAASPKWAPTLHVVSKTVPEKGLIVFFIFDSVIEEVPVKEFITLDGKMIEFRKTATRMTYLPREVELDIANGYVITPNGQQVPIDEVWKRAKADTMIAWSFDGKVPDRAFLAALNPQTLVVIQKSPMKK